MFLHSGSRGVGNRIAQHHVAVARKLCERWHVQLPHRDLAFLPEEDEAFWPYIRDLRWAQAFALENRSEMLDQVVAAIEHWSGEGVLAEEKILCHHNYTEQERHFGNDVWLTRKGAINAESGRPGLIPAAWAPAPTRSPARATGLRSTPPRTVQAGTSHAWRPVGGSPPLISPRR